MDFYSTIYHQRTSTAEETLNNQVGKIIQSVDVSQSLSSSTSVLDGGRMDRVGTVAKMEASHWFSSIRAHLPRLIYL